MSHWARTAVMVANGRAGGAASVPVREVAETCRGLVGEVSVVRTGYPGHARTLAAKATRDGADVVLSVGGDGTAGEVAGGIVTAVEADSRLVGPALLGVPAGTGNSFYKEIWQDRPWYESIATALGGTRPHIRQLDLARVEETRDTVLLGACSGLVAEALDAAADLTRLTGRVRYQEAVATTLRDFVPHPARIVVDGEVVHDGSVILANVGGGRYRGGGFLLLPRSVLDDGLLDVCVVTGDLDPRELPGLTRNGRHLERSEVLYRRGRRIEIERTDGAPLTFEWDGEVQRGRARYALDVLPAVLPVLSPTGPP
ncbi:sphingosine kinase [Streptomyces longisporoflavus]|uniref:diacylglycerol/lipid kinase family protein n=1 Tax=Streptomyces longisporoflavus TaxID=28044 RepID=UPI0019937C3A|nr:diacylglycerol kinase family protein [Streptomyces longisporoflavus]GGV35079.1 sphingosine kinase [Streptomyces longisporoflavus]